MTMGSIRTFHVSEVQLFLGNEEQAKELSQTDADQHMILEFKAYIGDPSKRTTCEFEVTFQDGSILWIPWSNDIYLTVQYETFCRVNRELYPLLFTVEESKQRIKAIRAQPITDVQNGTIVYISLRAINPYWYDGLNLDDPYHVSYVVAMEYGDWTKRNSKRHISANIDVYQQHYVALDNYFVTFYGFVQQLNSSMILIDEQYLLQHPELMPTTEILSSLPKKP
jgi:hypothetical protein